MGWGQSATRMVAASEVVRVRQAKRRIALAWADRCARVRELRADVRRLENVIWHKQREASLNIARKDREINDLKSACEEMLGGKLVQQIDDSGGELAKRWVLVPMPAAPEGIPHWGRITFEDRSLGANG